MDRLLLLLTVLDTTLLPMWDYPTFAVALQTKPGAEKPFVGRERASRAALLREALKFERNGDLPRTHAGVQAYVTHMTNDDYVFGALVLGASLLEVGATRPLIAMITDGVSTKCRRSLRKFGWHVLVVPEFGDARTDLGFSRGFFTKLEAWRLPCQRVVYLDTDILVVRNPDNLFDLSECRPKAEFFAVPDSQPHMDGTKRTPNTGVMILKPNLETYCTMRKKLREAPALHDLPSYEQGFLGDFFPAWAELSPEYNFCIRYANRPLYKDVRRESAVIIHYAKCKPWDPSLQLLVLQDVDSQGFKSEYEYYIRLYHEALKKCGLKLDDARKTGKVVWNDVSEEVHNQRRWARLLSSLPLPPDRDARSLLPKLRGDFGGPGPTTRELWPTPGSLNISKAPVRRQSIVNGEGKNRRSNCRKSRSAMAPLRERATFYDKNLDAGLRLAD
mmetsp:Transcript_18960/g.26415  ORF Transcript_18960/g.26415 Transcript_18960/m.26415 type:complete len:445 (-) Transcript_18960:33-1367(-)